MRSLFVIADKEKSKLNEEIDKLLDYVDNVMTEPVIRVVDVKTLKDTIQFDEFKEAVDEQDFDLYIMTFNNMSDVRDIEAMLKDAGYNYSAGNEILLTRESDMCNFITDVYGFCSYELDLNDPKVKENFKKGYEVIYC